MYASDYDQYSPPQMYPTQTGTNPVQQEWAGIVLPYIKNNQIYLCPTDPNQTNGSGKQVGTQATSFGSGIRRVPNADLNFWGTNEAVMNFTQVQYPAEKFLIAECSTNQAGMCGPPSTNFAQWHNLGCNIGYVDGHAGWMANLAIPQDLASASPLPAGPGDHFWYGVDAGTTGGQTN
jgi:prepilin-type processing-associated H-X9-DG protein